MNDQERSKLKDDVLLCLEKSGRDRKDIDDFEGPYLGLGDKGGMFFIRDYAAEVPSISVYRDRFPGMSYWASDLTLKKYTPIATFTIEELYPLPMQEKGLHGTRYDLGDMSITIRFDSPEWVYMQKNGECIELNLSTPEIAYEFTLAANDIIVKALRARNEANNG